MRKKVTPRRQGGRYAAELERLRELNAVKEVLAKSEIENAALINTSKDSETVSDNSIDRMLDQLDIGRHSNKDLEIVEGLSDRSTRLAKSIAQSKPAANRKAKRSSKPKRAKQIKDKKKRR